MSKPVRILVIAFLIILGAGVATALYFIATAILKGDGIPQEELLGTWTANFRTPPDSIVLKKDLKYVHTYVLPNGKKVVDTDSWELENASTDPKINFHHFALFLPEQESYTCTDDWKVDVVPKLNKYRIIVDSEQNFYFEK